MFPILVRPPMHHFEGVDRAADGGGALRGTCWARGEAQKSSSHAHCRSDWLAGAGPVPPGKLGRDANHSCRWERQARHATLGRQPVPAPNVVSELSDVVWVPS